MEVNGQESVKRTRPLEVDPDDGTEITSSKKVRIDPDAAKKIKCLKFLLIFWGKIHTKLNNPTDADWSNISWGNQIMNILLTAFSIQRQAANFSGNAATKAEEKDFTATSFNKKYTISYDDTMTLCTEAATEAGLEFKQYWANYADNWYGIAATYAYCFAGNNLRLQELKLGHDKMPIGIKDGQSIEFPVWKYGLFEEHHVLLEGCTYPPEKRSAMAQCVGPMTAMLCHIRSPSQYRQKWTSIAKKTMAHVPVIDEILNAVQGRTPFEISRLISVLADILLVTTTRQGHRMFFPINALYRMWMLEVGANGFILDEKKIETVYAGGDAILSCFRVSGTGGFYLYKLMCNFNWVLEGNMNNDEAAQILYHTIFGIYKEDLSVLSRRTNLSIWKTREELGNICQKMATSAKSATFKPVVMRSYAKLSFANQTGHLAATYGQVSSLPVFSGKRRQHFCDEFLQQINKKVEITMGATTIPGLTAILVQTLSELVKQKKTLDICTVTWCSMDELTYDTCYSD